MALASTLLRTSSQEYIIILNEIPDRVCILSSLKLLTSRQQHNPSYSPMRTHFVQLFALLLLRPIYEMMDDSCTKSFNRLHNEDF